ncbi:MAG TPA: thioredoxin family protein [Candidatus Sulfobium mesophilum]|nr:thioredoxin family protein [Candidatus Sulfobium mesophilum]
MRRSVIVVIISSLLLASNAFADVSIKWYTLAEGQAKSKADGKPVIVDFFFGKGCPRCEFLEKEVYSNPSIAKKIMEDFVPIRIDLTGKLSKEEQQLGDKYEFKNDCLLIFLDRSGNLMKEASGKRLCFVDKVEPDDFIKYLDTVKSSIGK